MSRCLGVTATLCARASRCRGVEGVATGFSAINSFWGELALAGDNGMRVLCAPCLAGVVPAVLLPRFPDGFSSSSSTSTSISSPSQLCFFGVTKGLSFSPSSRITNWARRFARVETVDGASREGQDASSGRNDGRCLPEVFAATELRVLFPRTVAGILSNS